MSAYMPQFISFYVRTYKGYALDFWENITPMQYGCLLIGVMAFGYLFMKSTMTK